MNTQCEPATVERSRGNRPCCARRLIVTALAFFCGGCGAFNPAFVALLDPSGSGQFARLGNAPGHVVIAFINNATVDERLLDYLESSDGGNLVLTDVERASLRPRVRLRVLITFTDGATQTLEFIDGSATLVDQSFNAESVSDLNQNDLGNAVVVCDVARVELAPGSSIEVFVPVELLEFELVETGTGTGAVVRTFELRARIPPQFRVLQVDTVDADGNVEIRNNIDQRDRPSPALRPLCGSVVAITMDGVLSVPFLDGVSDQPSYDRDDQASVGGIGGRYEFRVSVQ